ncbi:MAG: hypothetical protein N2645_15265 [Clostridia bacterium]|nr:hypothetical protein [Clostridia bacterium]
MSIIDGKYDCKINKIPFKQLNNSALVIVPEPVYRYPEGHPCYGCTYTFQVNRPSCIIGAKPGKCSLRKFEKNLREK